MAVSLRSHRPLTKISHILHGRKKQDIVVKIDVLETASNIVDRVAEKRVCKVQLRVPMGELVPVHKPSKVNIVKRTNRVHSFPDLHHRLSHL